MLPALFDAFAVIIMYTLPWEKEDVFVQVKPETIDIISGQTKITLAKYSDISDEYNLYEQSYMLMQWREVEGS